MRGVRVGNVVDGDALWLYEADHERWLYRDGTRLRTYATPEPPNASGREPPAGAGIEGSPTAPEPPCLRLSGQQVGLLEAPFVLVGLAE